MTVGANGVTVDAAKVVATDVLATNAVIRVIDSVILPDWCPRRRHAPLMRRVAQRFRPAT